MRTGQARRRDANEGSIVAGLRAVGATVFLLSGAGVPDLLVAFRGTWMPLEVKTAKGTLTPLQAAVRVASDAVVPIVRNMDDALKAIGCLSKDAK
jgi:hypothetical protein